jgi:proteasome accessory factor C
VSPRAAKPRAPRKRPPAESATDRLARLLTMVPWLLHRQGIDIEQAAAELQVSREQLEADLALLFLCGTPGGMPDDLIEADWEDGRVYLGNAEAIARPLRLGRDEALALIVALRTLADIPGLTERDALDRTLAKLEDAISSAAAPTVQAASERIQVDMAEGTEAATLAALRDALARKRRVHLRYLVPARDESTARDVDPMRLTSAEGRWYFEGWCHRSDAVRLFRLDRIEEVSVLDEPGVPPDGARPRDLDAGIFQPGPDDLLVSLRLAPSAAWVADYYPHVSHQPDDQAGSGSGGGGVSERGTILRLHTADTAWLRRLLWRLGGQAMVQEPAWLAEEVAQGAAAALSAYGHAEPVH